MKYSLDIIMKIKRSPLIPVMPDEVAAVNAKARKKKTGRSRSTSPQPQEFAINGEFYIDSSVLYDQHASTPIAFLQNGGNWWEQAQFQDQAKQQYLGLQHFGYEGQPANGLLTKEATEMAPVEVPNVYPPGFEPEIEEKSQFLHSMMRRRSQTLQALADCNGDLSSLQDKVGKMTVDESDQMYDKLVREANMVTANK
eukprot:NODE_175_length_14138_cov_1.015314.p10 type:complete len:197 gc:universal NODE_175_length_14138_cov_1.015314:11855-12445(+)